MVLAEACEGREASNFTFPMVTKAGRKINILLNTTARKDEAGVVTGVVGVGQDVTHLREALGVLGREAVERGTCETLLKEAADIPSSWAWRTWRWRTWRWRTRSRR